jgi:hypothetical protein
MSAIALKLGEIASLATALAAVLTELAFLWNRALTCGMGALVGIHTFSFMTVDGLS